MIKTKIHIALYLLFFSLATHSVFAAKSITAAGLSEAQRLLSEGQYQDSLSEYRKHADHDPLAQFSVGLFYQQGWYVNRDSQAACEWFGKAAKGKIPTTQYFYARCMLDGPLKKNAQKAAHWFQQAIEGGYFAALCDLGQLYMRGDGVEKDIAKGEALCYEAAMKSAIDAQIFLGLFYSSGEFVDKDEQKSLHWLTIAAKKGHPKAQYQLAKMFQEGNGTPRDPNKAVFWYESAASQGYALAYYDTAILYYELAFAKETEKPESSLLAKNYLWLSAALAKEMRAVKRQQLKKRLTQVDKVMPATWRPDLDKKVQMHLSKN